MSDAEDRLGDKYKKYGNLKPKTKPLSKLRTRKQYFSSADYQIGPEFVRAQILRTFRAEERQRRERAFIAFLLCHEALSGDFPLETDGRPVLGDIPLAVLEPSLRTWVDESRGAFPPTGTPGWSP
jgi:hypothetical protein